MKINNYSSINRSLTRPYESPNINQGITRAAKILGQNKAIAVLLMWHFATSILYSLFLKPSAYLQLASKTHAAIVASFIATIFLILTPLASLVADVKFGRFKTLLWSTYFMIVSTCCTLLSGILLLYTVHDFKFYFYFPLISCFISLLVYLCARIFFIANVLQFGTDQLRDQPTRKSIVFLLMYYWCDTLSNLLSLSTNFPSHEFVVSQQSKVIKVDTTRKIYLLVLVCSSIIMSVIVLIGLKKKKSWFLMENINRNPYVLIYKILKFAFQNKQPIRRSAFTYCENRLPSRLDFAKVRYGGPFTTEEVEDVKTFFNMLKVFISLGPAFFIDLCGISLISQHPTHVEAHHEINYPLKMLFLNYGLLSSMLTVLLLPLLYQLLFSKYFPSMFKRMGLSILLLCILYFIYILHYLVGNSQNYFENWTQNSCFNNDSLNPSHTEIIPSFSRTYVVAIHNVISSLYHILLYISSWEFICSQSPQHMKGLLFATFYAVRALYRALAAIVILAVLHYIKTKYQFSCLLSYYTINFTVGLISLIIFARVANKYKYRKRDDICNIYQYAEEYYSKTESNRLT